jgi:hypothetical protein
MTVASAKKSQLVPKWDVRDLAMEGGDCPIKKN